MIRRVDLAPLPLSVSDISLYEYRWSYSSCLRYPLQHSSTREGEERRETGRWRRSGGVWRGWVTWFENKRNSSFLALPTDRKLEANNRMCLYPGWCLAVTMGHSLGKAILVFHLTPSSPQPCESHICSPFTDKERCKEVKVKVTPLRMATVVVNL